MHELTRDQVIEDLIADTLTSEDLLTVILQFGFEGYHNLTDEELIEEYAKGGLGMGITIVG